MRRILLIACSLLLLSIVAGACRGEDTAPGEFREVRVEGGSYRDITPAQLKTMLENKEFPLVNVHIPYEGEIPGTDLFVPYNDIETNLDRLPADRQAKIVLYCRSGSMSATAAKTMVRLGYRNIWNLDGGMVAWEAQGNPLLRK